MGSPLDLQFNLLVPEIFSLKDYTVPMILQVKADILWNKALTTGGNNDWLRFQSCILYNLACDIENEENQ